MFLRTHAEPSDPATSSETGRRMRGANLVIRDRPVPRDWRDEDRCRDDVFQRHEERRYGELRRPSWIGALAFERVATERARGTAQDCASLTSARVWPRMLAAHHRSRFGNVIGPRKLGPSVLR